MENTPGPDGGWPEESAEESERDHRLRVLHARYDAALENGDWKSFQDSYRKYLELYLEDDPHYADPIVRRDYIQKQLERYRPRFGGSGRQPLLGTVIWILLGLVALVIAYFLIRGIGG
ncbi:MAG: hypothetical protein R6U36_02470 [Candidatus Fermentibacteraceae bacterium]